MAFDWGEFGSGRSGSLLDVPMAAVTRTFSSFRPMERILLGMAGKYIDMFLKVYLATP